MSRAVIPAWRKGGSCSCSCPDFCHTVLPRRGMVPRKILEERVSYFQEVVWLRLLEESQACEREAHRASSRRRRDQVDSVEKRANKALSLIQVGELFAAQVSLEGAEVASGTLSTLRELTNTRQELSQEVARSEQSNSIWMWMNPSSACFPTSRRGAAEGRSGMTSEHLFPILDNAHDSAVFPELRR